MTLAILHVYILHMICSCTLYCIDVVCMYWICQKWSWRNSSSKQCTIWIFFSMLKLKILQDHAIVQTSRAELLHVLTIYYQASVTMLIMMMLYLPFLNGSVRLLWQIVSNSRFQCNSFRGSFLIFLIGNPNLGSVMITGNLTAPITTIYSFKKIK